jgi:hypothetical protein
MAMTILAAAPGPDVFASGALVGFLAGLLARPALRAWLWSRERSAVAAEAADMVLTEREAPPFDEPIDSPLRELQRPPTPLA